MEDLQPPTTTTTPADLSPSDDSFYLDSNCSTPFVSAPSSPGRAGGGYFYSAPASPVHFVLSKATLRSSAFVPLPSENAKSGSGSSEFEFSARFAATCNDHFTAEEIGSMSSADELFLNGQIRPLKLSTHLQRPQVLPPLADAAESDGNGDSSEEIGEVEDRDFSLRSRDSRLCNKSLRRRARSLSPLRDTASFDWTEQVVTGESDGGANLMSKSDNNGDETVSDETTPCASASSSRCSSAGRSSKRWLFLKDFLRSKSEGRSNHKFWTNISLSPAKDKKSPTPQQSEPVSNPKKKKTTTTTGGNPPPATQKPPRKSPANGVGKRRVPLSAHELHYTANRAQAEEMRKKTYLPYRQGLLGCLGFSSKSYGAMNGLARALNPVSSG